MGKSIRGRRRMASRQCRMAPYPIPSCNLNVSEDLNENKSSIVMLKKDLEDVTCSVCMEYPHNAVLLLCSSHEKGCRPYMCGTSSRYSNCLDQYKKAYTKITPPHQAQHFRDTNDSPVLDATSGLPVDKCGELAELACPLCRGQVKGWTVVESAREYLNGKTRTCMHDNCSFVGAYRELKKHVKSEHPCAKPREVDPDQEQKRRRLEREREREDVISTITSSIPGSVVFGDYVIERNTNGLDSDDEDEGLGVGIDTSLVNMLFLFQAFGSGGNVDPFDNDDGDGNNNYGMSLVNRLRRQGRVRRRHRVGSRGQGQT